MKKKQIKILEKYFKIYKDEDQWELERWTDRGVDMTIDINIKDDIGELFNDYINNFDIDEEIDLYRQGVDYKNAFTIRESLEDFEGWILTIESIKKELEEAK